MVGFILFILFLWTISCLSIFKPVLILKISDYFRIKGKVEYTDYAIHSVIFGGVVMFIVSLVLIYFYITDVYVFTYLNYQIS